MGAYAPAPVVTPAVHARVMETIVDPPLRGMAAEGMPFRGVLFVGLMIEGDVPRVLEFNVRFGDPETTVLVPMLDGDWLALLDGAARGDLAAAAAASRTHDGAALAVVMAAEGYPGKPRVGDAIDGLDAALAGFAARVSAGTVQATAANAVLQGLARILVPLNFTREPRFRHDPAYTVPPLPALAVAGEWTHLPAEHRGFALTQLLRGRNQTIAARRDATRMVTAAG
jgi:phosphoribosylamine-glycine ligase